MVGHIQYWQFPAYFGPILGYFRLFKTKSWLSPAHASSHRHVLSVSNGGGGGGRVLGNSEYGGDATVFITDLKSNTHPYFTSLAKKPKYHPLVQPP